MKYKGIEDQVKILTKNKTRPVKTFLKILLDPELKWRLPEGFPEIEVKSYATGKAPLSLLDHMRSFFVFFEGGRSGNNLPVSKLEQKFLQLYSSICDDDRKYLLGLKDRTIKFIRPKAVEKVWPGLISSEKDRLQVLGKL